MEYCTMVELSLLAPEIRIQIQVRTKSYQIQINYIGCVMVIIQAYNHSGKQL